MKPFGSRTCQGDGRISLNTYLEPSRSHPYSKSMTVNLTIWPECWSSRLPTDATSALVFIPTREEVSVSSCRDYPPGRLRIEEEEEKDTAFRACHLASPGRNRRREIQSFVLIKKKNISPHLRKAPRMTPMRSAACNDTLHRGRFGQFGFSSLVLDTIGHALLTWS